MHQRRDDEWLEISPEVTSALAARRPVVGLESVVIAHGLPQPTNLEVAREMEARIRLSGAVPATIWLHDGQIRVGATDDDLNDLATMPGIRKVSRRDLPIVLARREPGATTVATTLFAAQRAGIGVVATGGIGAVARGGERSWDVSNDLAALAQCNVALVSAGAKSLMDARLTRELLETLGVAALGWQTDELPAFYSARTGERVDLRVETAAEAAAVVATNQALGLTGSVLVAVPPPPEVALTPAEVDAAVDQALADAAAAGQTGSDLTPFALAALARITAGRSQHVNAALLLRNAEVAGAIAVALADRS